MRVYPDPLNSILYTLISINSKNGSPDTNAPDTLNSILFIPTLSTLNPKPVGPKPLNPKPLSPKP